MKKTLLTSIMVFILGFLLLNAQTKVVTIPLLGSKAPSFKAESTLGKIKFPDDFGKSWKILLSHPKDFTPVCSSEILELSHQQSDYEKLNVKVIVLSVDHVDQHKAWVDALNEVTYKDRAPVKIDFPIIDDSDYKISNKYGMIHPEVSAAENIRAVFIIDPDNFIRSINFYPMQVGRNMAEIKRTIVALQTIDEHKSDVAPANWQPGEELMVPYLTVEEKKEIGNPDSKIEQVTWFMNFRKN